MTPTEAIAVLTPLLEDAQRRRDDRANQFSEVHLRHLSPEMREYYETRHDDAARQVEALTLAIVNLQNACSASET